MSERGELALVNERAEFTLEMLPVDDELANDQVQRRRRLQVILDAFAREEELNGTEAIVDSEQTNGRFVERDQLSITI